MTARPIFYDTETTGLKAEKDRIIELAAYDPVRDCTFHQLIHPQCAIPKEATAIHNISNEMVADAPSFSDIAEAWCTFCEGEVVLIAHNNDAFDVHFLRHEFLRCNRTLPEWKFLDSLKWARKYRPDLPRHTLQFLREIYGISANNAHRALDDVKILHEVFSAMTDDLSIETILQLLSAPAKPIQNMPFGKHQGQPLDKVPKDYVKWLSNSGAFDKEENRALKERFVALGIL